jgi:hypothetical protein
VAKGLQKTSLADLREHGISPNFDRPMITKLKVFQTNGSANDGKQTTTNSGNGGRVKKNASIWFFLSICHSVYLSLWFLWFLRLNSG